ncbi:MAG: small multi-drug export protein [Campylobacteraceae bacterium]|jgi:uncharacterized membrane protein|nr:small multi-drug export protein [Campylobacteraceae bacterium]
MNYSKRKIVLLSTTGLFAFFLILMVSISFIDTKLAGYISSMALTNILIGRVPSISLGTSLDLDILTVVFTIFTTEAILSLFFYTLFLYSLRNIKLFESLSNQVIKLHNTASQYKEYIDKYGMFGLLFFVFMPFWMTGPVVGIIIGDLMNFSLVKNITIVAIGTFVAIFCWAVMIKYFIEYIQVFI